MASLFRELGRLSARGARALRPSRSPPGGTGASGRLRTALVAGLVLAVGLLVAPTSPAAVLGIAALALGVAAVYDAVEIVQPYERREVTVFGADWALLEPGLHVVPPFVSKAYRYDMRTETLGVPSQEAITRDNSPVTADAVVYIRVTDARRAFLAVEDYRGATLNLAQTALRAVIGDMELDETLSRRDEINRRIRDQLAEPTDEWGVRVESVEVREVTPAAGVVDAMERQTAAERHRRAAILEAQGKRRSAVERAEGERAAKIIRARGERRADVIAAQGDAVSTVLRARSAQAMGERAILDRGFETTARIGDGPAETYVLPQELFSVLGRTGRSLPDGRTAGPLASRPFDDETRAFLGLDEVDAVAAGTENVAVDGETER
jgi:regulator of protease activity HflC (stomatin/prohibitin superfamily)